VAQASDRIRGEDPSRQRFSGFPYGSQSFLTLAALAGEAYWGGGAYLLPRDEIKLGQLFFDGGTWHGKRILSRAWVEESLSTQARFDPVYSLGQEHGYGYGWHVNYLTTGGVKYRALAAQGNGGQFVVVIPALNLVVGINGGASENSTGGMPGSLS
jgi:CubicO group peptidase (beta-lactamase class C family)